MSVTCFQSPGSQHDILSPCDGAGESGIPAIEILVLQTLNYGPRLISFQLQREVLSESLIGKLLWLHSSNCSCSVAKSCPTLCHSMDCSMTGGPVLHHLPQLAQTHVHWGFPGGSVSKKSTCNVGDLGSIPGLGRSLGGGAWQNTAVFLPREFCGQRSLAVCSPMGLERVGHN